MKSFTWHTILAALIESGFITPSGEWVPVEFGAHNQFALTEMHRKYDHKKTVEWADYVTCLLVRGYIRISVDGGTVGIEWGIPSSAARSTLIERLAAWGNANVLVEHIHVRQNGIPRLSVVFEGTAQECLDSNIL